MDEIRKAFNEMKQNRAPGEDQIITELIKEGEDELMKYLNILFNRCIEEMKLPDDWNNPIIVLIYKKGDKIKLENYGPISLFSQTYNLPLKINTNTLTTKMDPCQPPEQASYRKSYSTIDHIQILRNLIEKTIEYNTYCIRLL